MKTVGKISCETSRVLRAGFSTNDHVFVLPSLSRTVGSLIVQKRVV